MTVGSAVLTGRVVLRFTVSDDLSCFAAVRTRTSPSGGIHGCTKTVSVSGLVTAAGAVTIFWSRSRRVTVNSRSSTV